MKFQNKKRLDELTQKLLQCVHCNTFLNTFTCIKFSD